MASVAGGLLAAGIGPGETVALYLGNTPWHPVAFFAAARAGARLVHLSPLDAPRELAWKLSDSGAKTLITMNVAALLPRALALLEKGAVARLMVAEDGAWGAGAEAPLPVTWSANVHALPRATLPGRSPELREEDICLLQ